MAVSFVGVGGGFIREVVLRQVFSGLLSAFNTRMDITISIDSPVTTSHFYMFRLVGNFVLSS